MALTHSYNPLTEEDFDAKNQERYTNNKNKLSKYEAELTKKPEDIVFLNRKANLLLKMKAYKEAKECFEKVLELIKIRLDGTDILKQDLKYYESKNEGYFLPANGIEECSIALASQLRVQGEYQYLEKNYEEAIEYFDKALILYQDGVSINNHKANALYQLERFHDAAIFFKNAKRNINIYIDKKGIAGHIEIKKSLDISKKIDKKYLSPDEGVAFCSYAISYKNVFTRKFAFTMLFFILLMMLVKDSTKNYFGDTNIPEFSSLITQSISMEFIFYAALFLNNLSSKGSAKAYPESKYVLYDINEKKVLIDKPKKETKNGVEIEQHYETHRTIKPREKIERGNRLILLHSPFIDFRVPLTWILPSYACWLMMFTPLYNKSNIIDLPYSTLAFVFSQFFTSNFLLFTNKTKQTNSSNKASQLIIHSDSSYKEVQAVKSNFKKVITNLINQYTKELDEAKKHIQRLIENGFEDQDKISKQKQEIVTLENKVKMLEKQLATLNTITIDPSKMASIKDEKHSPQPKNPLHEERAKLEAMKGQSNKNASVTCPPSSTEARDHFGFFSAISTSTVAGDSKTPPSINLPTASINKK